MRFDSPEHLAAWRQWGSYPKIHDPIGQMIVAEMRGKRVLDLGCSYGLLSDRIAHHAMADFVLGVDSDAEALAAGREASIRARLVDMKVNAGAVERLAQMVREERITVLVARRILPELFGDDLPGGRHFAEELRGAGIDEVFLEGRVSSVKSVSKLRSIEEEVQLMAGPFQLSRRSGSLAYLVARR